jgi:hypothetical protein
MAAKPPGIGRCRERDFPRRNAMMEWLTLKIWSPYAVGIGIGLLSCVTLLLSYRAILNRGNFGDITWPRLLNANPWAVVLPLATSVIVLLFLFEKAGL